MADYKIKVWRQSPLGIGPGGGEGPGGKEGKFETYTINNIDSDLSFLEMLDILNQQLLQENNIPIAFDHDCREGICGACSLVINGVPHGPESSTTTCQLYMRHFEHNSTIIVEPFRAKAFPVIQDLVVDRSAFDRIMQAGGYISVHTGAATDANTVLIAKQSADDAFTAATCIGCGACVAACKNASAMLFVAAKTSQLGLLPQGQPEKTNRTLKMVQQMQLEGFGNCSNHYECEAACPKNIPASYIAQLNKDFLISSFTNKEFECQNDNCYES
ncbi:MAG: succinate dehydrogenase/fumarate reductase iron-sulfur subunit [Gammaproteobacteria bacterium]|nr:succinate dehydrogenase/fumarate reductase iron-sulfur subunit [Gammaproteobacteria bacterium]